MKREISELTVGVVGATGAVGREVIQVLMAHGFKAENIRALASERSHNTHLELGGRTWPVAALKTERLVGLAYVIFAAGAVVSREWASEAVRLGATVIDNSSAFRIDLEVPLVVPEINPEALEGHRGIIANPNCSTIIALMALAPLHRAFGLQRFIASTYQAVSGRGLRAIEELQEQVWDWSHGKVPQGPRVFPSPIAFNAFPCVGMLESDGYTTEEQKMLHESRKILNLPALHVSTTCVRVPVFRAHAVSLCAQFESQPVLEKAAEVLRSAPGVRLWDNLPEGHDKGERIPFYPTPLGCTGEWDCHVGRLRSDTALPNGLSLWCVGDQLLKGAALNAVQILLKLNA